MGMGTEEEQRVVVVVVVVFYRAKTTPTAPVAGGTEAIAGSGGWEGSIR